jgi:hypothetical protein
MFCSRQVHLSFLMSCKTSRSRADSVRGLWGARFELSQCRINSDRNESISSVVVHWHPTQYRLLS